MSSLDNFEGTRKKGIYLLPNLLTTSGLFSGFYAIVAAMKSDFEIAAIALFIAIIMDGLDGRAARLTSTESAFGAQYDSLSDMVCFGIAPALVVYSWGLHTLGKIGWLAAFFYSAATALRLARFNTQAENKDNRYFLGIPCPAAGGLIASMVWVGTDINIQGTHISELVALVTVSVAFLMISNIKYRSFKEFDLKDNVPFVAIQIVVLIYLLIAWDPPKVLFCIFNCYTLLGIMIWLRNSILLLLLKLKTSIQNSTNN